MEEALELTPELLAIIPKHKCDEESVDKVIEMGYPKIEPILPELLTWIQDLNWPIAGSLSHFLRDIGPPLKDYILEIFQTNDEGWKYSIVLLLLDTPDLRLAVALENDLRNYLVTGVDPDVSDAIRDVLQKVDRLPKHG